MFVKINLKTVSILIISILLDLALGFTIGGYYEKKAGLEQCKEAGWEFVDELFLSVPAKDRKRKEIQKIYMTMQSKIATKCIVRFDK